LGKLDEALKYYQEALDNAEKYNLRINHFFCKFIGQYLYEKKEVTDQR